MMRRVILATVVAVGLLSVPALAQGPFTYVNTASDVQAIFGGTTRDSTIQLGRASGGAAVLDVLHLSSNFEVGNKAALTRTCLFGGSPNGLCVDLNGAVSIGIVFSDASLHVVSLQVGNIPVIAESPTGQTEKTQVWRYGPGVGGDRAWMLLLGTSSTFGLLSTNFGDNVSGPVVVVGRNTSAGAAGPAAGAYLLGQATGGARYLWADSAGCLRYGRNPPTGNTVAATTPDTSGVVVGTCLP